MSELRATAVYRRNMLSLITVLLCFTLALFYGFYRIHLGVDLRDEGIYVTSPMRYVLGDVPFRDEFLNPHRMFDIVLWPLFSIHPEIGLLELRFFWLIFEIVAAITLFRLFRRFIPAPLVALSCIATIFLSNLIWTPGYHLMGIFGFVLSFSIWLTGCLAPRTGTQVASGLLSGAIFFGAVVSYLPLLAVAIVPAFVLLNALRGSLKRSGRLYASAAHLGALLFLILMALASLVAFDLVPDWLAAHEKILLSTQYGKPLLGKIIEFARQIGLGWAVMVATAIFLLLLSRLNRSAARGANKAFICSPAVGVSALGAAGFAILYFLGTGFGPSTCLAVRDSFRFLYPTMMTIGLHLWLLVDLQRKQAERDKDRDWNLVYVAMTSGSFILVFLLGYLGGMAFKTSFAILPLFVSGIAGVYRRLNINSGRDSGAKFSLIASVFFCLVVGFSSYKASWNCVYGDARMDRLTMEFSTPRLKGIYSTPENVAALDGLAAYLSPRLAQGDLLLVAGSTPLLYYLTGTRPALDHSWWALQFPITVLEDSLRVMRVRDRIPDFVIRVQLIGFGPQSNMRKLDADRWAVVLAALPGHYTLRERFGLYEIWEREE